MAVDVKQTLSTARQRPKRCATALYHALFSRSIGGNPLLYDHMFYYTLSPSPEGTAIANGMFFPANLIREQ